MTGYDPSADAVLELGINAYAGMKKFETEITDATNVPAHLSRAV